MEGETESLRNGGGETDGTGILASRLVLSVPDSLVQQTMTLSALGRGLVRVLCVSDQGGIILLSFYRGEEQGSVIGKLVDWIEEPFAWRAIQKNRPVRAPYGVVSEIGFVDHRAVPVPWDGRIVVTIDLPLEDLAPSLRDLLFPRRIVERMAVTLWGEEALTGLMSEVLKGRKGIAIWDGSRCLRWGSRPIPAFAELPPGFHKRDDGYWLVSPAGIVFSERRLSTPPLIGFSLIRSEIHHRVKNDLQSVIGSLRLQARRSPDPAARKALEVAADRVRAFAIVHDLLARFRGDAMSLRQLCQRLLQVVTEQAKSQEKQIRGAVIGTDLFLPPSQVSSVAMVLNELTRNAVDHAFPVGSAGTLSIVIERKGDTVTLSVDDDGVGFDPASLKESRLGLTIVRNLVEQDLKGSFTVASAPGKGTRATVQFTAPTLLVKESGTKGML